MEKQKAPTSRSQKKRSTGKLPGQTVHKEPEKYQVLTSHEQLQKEIGWCVEQLRMGLFLLKPTAKQVQESERILKTLTSTKAPLVKKRQVMHQTFGDYRKKIAAEESKWEKDAIQQMQLANITSSSTAEKGQFIRCAASSRLSNMSQRKNNCIENTADNLQSVAPVKESNLQMEKLEDQFEFCFSLADTQQEEMVKQGKHA